MYFFVFDTWTLILTKYSLLVTVNLFLFHLGALFIQYDFVFAILHSYSSILGYICSTCVVFHNISVCFRAALLNDTVRSGLCPSI